MIRNRYRRIVNFFARILLGFAWWELILPRLGLRGWARRTRSQRLQKAAAAYRLLAVQMGGVLIKVGQFLSARVDVLPREVTDELAGLQDEVPPERFEDIRRVVEAEFDQPLEQKFVQFDPEPLAAASLGQVHRAILPDGSQASLETHGVVVKVQRPNIELLISTDLAALNTVGGWLKRYRPINRRADVPALLQEFTKILYEEIDYEAEGRNAETFAQNFKDNLKVRVPGVIWSHTTKRALTLQNVLGIKITDYEAITAAGIDRAEVAARLLDTYLQQIFEDGFFHADPHPGNLFVQPLPQPQSVGGQPAGKRPWQLTFVDFGMVGHVPPHTKDGLREMLIGVGTQDAARVVRAYQTLGVLLPSADLALIEKAGSRVFERFWGKNMTELTHIDPAEIREFTSEFRELIFSMPFQVPQDFIFLARAVGILSGMCTGLDRSFNVWEHLEPYARKLMAEEVQANREFWFEEIKNLARAVLAGPLKLEAALGKLERGEVSVRTPDIARQTERLEGALRQLAASVLFGALLLGSVSMYTSGEPTLSAVLLAGAGLSLLWLLLAGGKK
jgi:predicted unusual protein kinase regulating ubiquinone biosynthesis (AarF/ABC1/UbiB family)